MQETVREVGSIPGSGRSSGGEHGNPLQYSCLKNLMDRRAWRAVAHRVANRGHSGDFPGGTMDENLPASAGHTSLIPGPGG